MAAEYPNLEAHRKMDELVLLTVPMKEKKTKYVEHATIIKFLEKEVYSQQCIADLESTVKA